MTDIPTEKIKMIKASLRCFVFGLLGLLPLLGLPFAVAALVNSGKVRAGQKFLWNPARPYWILGLTCAILGTIFWSFILMLVLFQVANTRN
jgi:hypothetical protein